MRTESTGEACHLAIYAATDEFVLRACRWAMELSSGFRSLEISLSPWIRQRLQGRCPHCCDYRCRFCKPCWHTVIPSSMGPVDTQIAQHDPQSRLVPSRRFRPLCQVVEVRHHCESRFSTCIVASVTQRICVWRCGDLNRCTYRRYEAKGRHGSANTKKLLLVASLRSLSHSSAMSSLVYLYYLRHASVSQHSKQLEFEMFARLFLSFSPNHPTLPYCSFVAPLIPLTTTSNHVWTRQRRA